MPQAPNAIAPGAPMREVVDTIIELLHLNKPIRVKKEQLAAASEGGDVPLDLDAEMQLW